MNAELRIPIRNFYYLLSYAWEEFQEGELKVVGKEYAAEVIHLLGVQFLRGLDLLAKEGWRKGIIQEERFTPQIKGKISWKKTIRNNALRQGKAFCVLPSQSRNIPLNQSIRAIYDLLLQHPSLARPLKAKLLNFRYLFEGIDPIYVDKRALADYYPTFQSPSYPLLLHICSLIYELELPWNNSAESSGYAILPEPDRMGRLFEQFIRNFFRMELAEYEVTRPIIKWKVDREEERKKSGHLPVMRTDMVLHGPHRKIIIDTKFYAKMFQHFHGHDSFISSHIYQLFAYLSNFPREKEHTALEGILLYAARDEGFQETYHLNGFPFIVKGLSLLLPPKEIHLELCRLIRS